MAHSVGDTGHVAEHNALSVPQAALNVVGSYNADNTGATSATSAILAACQAALTPNSRGKPNRGVYVPAGTYLLNTPLDFSTLTATGLTGGPTTGTTAGYIEGFSFICDPAAVFLMGTPTNSTAVNLAAPSTFQFYNCDFKFGTIMDPNHGTGNNGLTLTSVENSRISVQCIRNFAASGVLGAPNTTIGVFNNYIDVRLIRDCLYGFATNGNALPSAIGFQGNEVHLGQVASNTIGVNIDANGVNRSTEWNQFFIGAVENNSSHGVSDASGQNAYFIGAAEANTGFDFYLVASATFAPYVVGNLSSTNQVNLNGGKAYITNWAETDRHSTAAATSALSVTTATPGNVPGLTRTLVSPGAHAQWLVNVTLDVTSVTPSGATFIGKTVVDTTAQAAQLIAATATGNRGALSQTYLITGLSAGSHPLKVTAELTSAGSYTVNQTHSTLVVTRVA